MHASFYTELYNCTNREFCAYKKRCSKSITKKLNRVSLINLSEIGIEISGIEISANTLYLKNSAIMENQSLIRKNSAHMGFKRASIPE